MQPLVYYRIDYARRSVGRLPDKARYCPPYCMNYAQFKRLCPVHALGLTPSTHTGSSFAQFPQ